jgi:alkanesulfonate monooxygenase SsuD/methylene tetrahydromethanopterin reductase-like flavin-dependent oxidoreductase (luciferase family)
MRAYGGGKMQDQDEEIPRMEKLGDIMVLYRAEARRCRRSKAFLAGCVMVGAALEAALLNMAECYPEEARASAKAPRGNKALTQWNFAELLDVAKDLGWLPARFIREQDEFDSEIALVGDYAEVVREIRNLVHAGRYVADYRDTDVTRKHLTLSLEVLQAAVDHLLAKVEGSLRPKLARLDSTT